jgi:hypothetical protein
MVDIGTNDIRSQQIAESIYNENTFNIQKMAVCTSYQRIVVK